MPGPMGPGPMGPLQLANEAGLPIYNINSTNIDAVLLTLNQSQRVKDDIRNSVAAGKEVTIPKSYVTRNEWTGTGYVVRNPNTGEGAYKISSGLYGGAGTKSPASSGLGLLARQYAALALGKPSNELSLSSLGYWAESEVGDVYMNTYIYMLMARGFIPKYQHTYSKSELLNLIDQEDNVIIFYSGHGAAPGPNGDALTPGYADGKPEYVYPQDFTKANARIVFLNSCNSMHDQSFVGAFGDKNEVLLGWDKSVEYIASAQFVSEWWDNMFKGLTAWSSAEAISGGKYTSATILPEVPKIKITNHDFKL